MNYKEILDEIWIPLVFSTSPLDGGGYYLPYAFEYGDNGAIIVDGTLDSEIETECIILHECGHKITGRILSKLSPPQLHIINESKANRYMIHCKAEEWLNYMDDEDREYISIERFLNWCELNVREFYDMADIKKLGNEKMITIK